MEEKKHDIAEILDRIKDIKIASAPRLTSRKGSGGVIFYRKGIANGAS